MRISDLIKSENYTIKWLKDEYEKNNLFVDNSFQRRYVWLRKHQVSLIETILMGYVIPEIYIWETETDPDTGDTKYSIVDGQQRIGAIVSFINDEYRLTGLYLTNPSAEYAGKSFSQLSSTEKQNIWGYALSFRKILKEVGREDIVNVFLRLNFTDKSLNPQELRNAEYNGEFLKASLEIADEPFWKKHNIFSSEALRRMGDVEFISSLLIFMRKGIESEITQEAINEAYDLYNEKYDEAEEDKKIIRTILFTIEQIITRDQSGIFELYVRKNSHLYTIIVTLYAVVGNGETMSDRQKDNLLQFYKEYDDAKNESYEEYRELFQGGTRSKSNRMKRVKILSEIINR